MKMMTKIFVMFAISAGSVAHANGHGGTGKDVNSNLSESSTGGGIGTGGTWNMGGTGTCPGVGGSGIGPHSALAFGHGSNGMDATRSPTGGHGGNGLTSVDLSKSVNPPTSNVFDSVQV